MNAMTHSDFIDALGGGTAVAEALKATGEKIDREAVYKWRRNGVPLKWRAKLARIAQREEVKLPDGFEFWEAA